LYVHIELFHSFFFLDCFASNSNFSRKLCLFRTIPPLNSWFYLKRSPSSYNIQPSQIILVHDEPIKQEIASVAMIGKGNQYRTRDCSVLAVFCADLQPSLRIRRILQLEQLHMAKSQVQGRHPDYLATMPISTSFMFGEGHLATLVKQTALDFISSATSKPMPEIDPVRVWAYKNTSLMVQTYVLAATSHNLQTCIMEGFDPRHLKDILQIPNDRYGIPMVVATGYEYVDSNSAEEDKSLISPQTARLSIDEVVFHNAFGTPIQFEKRKSN
jgi:nitroreductase